MIFATQTVTVQTNFFVPPLPAPAPANSLQESTCSKSSLLNFSTSPPLGYICFFGIFHFLHNNDKTTLTTKKKYIKKLSPLVFNISSPKRMNPQDRSLPSLPLWNPPSGSSSPVSRKASPSSFDGGIMMPPSSGNNFWVGPVKGGAPPRGATMQGLEQGFTNMQPYAAQLQPQQHLLPAQPLDGEHCRW